MQVCGNVDEPKMFRTSHDLVINGSSYIKVEHFSVRDFGKNTLVFMALLSKIYRKISRYFIDR